MIHPKKKVCACARVHACTRVRLLLVLVCRIMYHIRTYLISARLPKTKSRFEAHLPERGVTFGKLKGYERAARVFFMRIFDRYFMFFQQQKEKKTYYFSITCSRVSQKTGILFPVPGFWPPGLSQGVKVPSHDIFYFVKEA